MNRNYLNPREIRREYDVETWCATRETHPAVGYAIHAISDSSRTPNQIWEAPTNAEYEHVTMAIDEFITHGDFSAEPDGRYQWGAEVITLLEDR